MTGRGSVSDSQTKELTCLGISVRKAFLKLEIEELFLQPEVIENIDYHPL